MSTPNFLKYASKTDISLCIDILKVARDKIKGSYSEGKLTPSINRVILELEDLK